MLTDSSERPILDVCLRLDPIVIAPFCISTELALQLSPPSFKILTVLGGLAITRRQRPGGEWAVGSWRWFLVQFGIKYGWFANVLHRMNVSISPGCVREQLASSTFKQLTQFSLKMSGGQLTLGY